MSEYAIMNIWIVMLAIFGLFGKIISTIATAPADTPLISFLKEIENNHEKVEIYLKQNRIAIFVSDAEGKVLLHNENIKKREDMDYLHRVGYVKGGCSYIVRGYEHLFNY